MGDPSDLPPGTFYVPLVDGVSDPPAPPSVLLPNNDDISLRVGTLYGLLGVLFGSFLTGGFAFYGAYPMAGGILALVGAGGLIVMAILLIWYRLKVIHALIVTLAALVATLVVFGYVVSTRPTAEDIDKATAPIKAELRSEKQLADNTQRQLGQLQTQLETAEERLTKVTAQLGPPSSILKLDDARRWQIVKSIVEGMPEATQQGCGVDVAYDRSNQTEYLKSANVWGEVQLPLYFSGWRFPHQILKTFFPPGFSITVGAKTGYAHECAVRLKDLLDQLNIRPSTVVVDVGNTDLQTCNNQFTNQCIEMTISKLDTP
jgi:hypothetical protein